MAHPALPALDKARLGTVFVLRHGRSLANEAGIIISRMDNGVLAKYALAPEGVRQAEAAGAELRAWLDGAGLAAADVRVVSSPFSRTLQTAAAAVAQLGLPADAVQPDDALAERFFGDELEGTPHRRVHSRARRSSQRI